MSRHAKKLKEELEAEQNIEDEASEDEDEAINGYDITSYGIDFDVEGLVRKFDRGDIFIPPFQRNFVWELVESSRLLESLLLGLPVPGIFLAHEPQTKKLLVIDGQQRLRSLLYFFKGTFKMNDDETKSCPFKLKKVQPQFEGKTFEELESKDRINLENCVIHATVVKQDSPADGDTSIYHIFERLNSGGRKLQPQEIRTAIYHGNLIDSIDDLNRHASWRDIYGKINKRKKDQELIIRYFAMLDGYYNYDGSMKEFLNKFVKKYRNGDDKIKKYTNSFRQCCDIFLRAIDGRPFRRLKAINVAFYEAAMVALTEKIKRDGVPSDKIVKQKYNLLLKDEDFDTAISESTGNKASVLKRIKRAKEIFMAD